MIRWVTSAVTGCMKLTSVRGPEDADGRLGLRDESTHRQVFARQGPRDDPALSLPRDQKEDGPRIEQRAQGQGDAGNGRFSEAGGNGPRELGGGEPGLEAGVAGD